MPKRNDWKKLPKETGDNNRNVKEKRLRKMVIPKRNDWKINGYAKKQLLETGMPRETAEINGNAKNSCKNSELQKKRNGEINGKCFKKHWKGTEIYNNNNVIAM